MKYKFTCENDDITLKYKDKEFTFKRDVKLISQLQGLVMEARQRMIEDYAEKGKSIKNLTIETKKDGKTYYDNSNKNELEKIYQEKITLEFYNNKCIELFKMDLPTLMQDIELVTEEEGSKFANDFLTYLSGNIPR